MELIFAAIVYSDPVWLGFKRVSRPYSRVPMAGEGVNLGDVDADGDVWPVGHVRWINDGRVVLTFGFEPDDYEFAGVEALEAQGFVARSASEPYPLDDLA
jgi:hypothetical protein